MQFSRSINQPTFCFLSNTFFRIPSPMVRSLVPACCGGFAATVLLLGWWCWAWEDGFPLLKLYKAASSLLLILDEWPFEAMLSYFLNTKFFDLLDYHSISHRFDKTVCFSTISSQLATEIYLLNWQISIFPKNQFSFSLFFCYDCLTANTNWIQNVGAGSDFESFFHVTVMLPKFNDFLMTWM